MQPDKIDFRALLSSLDDDPFVNADQKSSWSAPTDGDSIFSFSPEQAAVKSAAPVKAETPAELTDPVLRSLVAEGILKAQHVTALAPHLQSLPSGKPAWRLALRLPGVAVDRVLATAAHVFNVPFVDLRKNPRYMLATTLASLPVPFKQQCKSLGLLPFACEINGKSGQLVLKIATCDPLRPDVVRFLQGSKSEIQLFYAPIAMLNECVQQIAAQRPE